MARKNVLNRAVEQPGPTDSDETVQVRALAWIGEGGIVYPPGAIFEVTRERAAAISKNAEIVSE